MMDWTDRHCRAFHRVMTRRALLYTEMVTAEAIIHGDREKLLGFSAMEHPVALQLGGSDPEKLAFAARIGADFGYDEINLNVGCPSDRVQSGRFGACLMREPDLVAECVAAMRAAVNVPVTVKSRIGVDDQGPREALFAFVEKVRAAGVATFIVHARKAWLDGLSPKDNREIPPLDYPLVRDLKRAHRDLTIILNGGLANFAQARAESVGLDGVMLGRAAYQKPAILLDADRFWFGEDNPCADAFEAVAAFAPYVAAHVESGRPLHAVTRHMLGLFHGQPGGRIWRRILTVESVKEGAGREVLDRALDSVRAALERAPRRDA
jgi:tRNA-dihydrouridine synthase A